MFPRKWSFLLSGVGIFCGLADIAGAAVYTGVGGPIQDVSYDDDGNQLTGITVFSIPVTDAGNVTKVNSVTLTNIHFDSLSDLAVTLTAPSGGTHVVSLFNPPDQDVETLDGTYKLIFDPTQQSFDDKYQSDISDPTISPNGYLDHRITIPGGTYAASEGGDGVQPGPHSTDAAFTSPPVSALGNWTVTFDNQNIENDPSTIQSLSLDLTTTTSPAPEPAALGLLACGGLLGGRRRRRV